MAASFFRADVALSRRRGNFSLLRKPTPHRVTAQLDAHDKVSDFVATMEVDDDTAPTG